ncbi:MAG: 3'(2'),5'-bisphosphate nucleotidase CysQ [Burkholderiales bacterium]|nr:3'(2'),5'-bisphosphate nucleotidase CysQ [Burkholderiales bacterium]MCL4688168.1 3'(2'),5'-bisphosphate nucleotidase CysQ [Burkholderiales bacterium]
MAHENLLERLIPVARQAGQAILAVYAGAFAARRKADDSPVTDADLAAEAIIVDALARLAPGVPVVSEESASEGEAPAVGGCFWLVDPLDGTREFVDRNGEFTVNIALVIAGEPVLGVVHAPALGELHAGERGRGAFVEAGGRRSPVRCAAPRAGGLVAVSSRSHGDADALERFLRGREVAATIGVGSSLKFCRVARGEADLYPRLGPTMEWDTAAGQAVLVAAGGRVVTLAGEPLRYGKPGFANPPFVAAGLAEAL